MTTPIPISDAAVEVALDAYWTFKGRMRDALEAAYPILAAEVRAEVFAELRKADEGAVMYSPRDDMPGIVRTRRVIDWLREQEISK